jgi:hypothetical protein
MHEVVAAQSGRSIFEKNPDARAVHPDVCTEPCIQSGISSVFIVPRCHRSELGRREQTTQRRRERQLLGFVRATARPLHGRTGKYPSPAYDDWSNASNSRSSAELKRIE